jgi:hypothetical protein
MPLKNRELDDYYTAIFATCTSEGHKYLLELAQKMRQEYADITKLKTEADLAYAKGRLDILDWFINIKPVYEAAYEHIEAQEEAENA